MKAGKGLLVSFVISSLFWIAVGCLSWYVFTSPSKSEIKGLAQMALCAVNDDIKSVGVIEVGNPDSVFGHCYLSDAESEMICESLTKTTDSIMNCEDKSFDELMSDPRTSSLINRHMDAFEVVRKNSFKPKGEFSGWRVKVRYKALNNDNVPMVNDFWAIIDPSGKFVINSFEIPVL